MNDTESPLETERRIRRRFAGMSEEYIQYELQWALANVEYDARRLERLARLFAIRNKPNRATKINLFGKKRRLAPVSQPVKPAAAPPTIPPPPVECLPTPQVVPVPCSPSPDPQDPPKRSKKRRASSGNRSRPQTRSMTRDLAAQAAQRHGLDASNIIERRLRPRSMTLKRK